MRRITVVMFASLVVPATAQGPDSGPCAWIPPATERVEQVRSVAQLHEAIARVRSNTTILVHPGEYRLRQSLEIGVPGVVLRGATRDRSRVVLRGENMLERQVGVAVGVSASDVTIADLTIGYVGYHGIQVRGERGASRVAIRNVRIIDTGQQLIKGSTAGGPLYGDHGLLACSTLEYSDHAPSNYTNGIDILGGRDWVVRDNRFLRIRGPAAERYEAGPAVLFWANSMGTRVERNTVIDSFRGIAFGLGPGVSNLARDGERSYDHQGGWIRNNVVVNMNEWADEGIEANGAGSVEIDYNTVVTRGSLPWSISLRFAQTNARARNNLTSKDIVLRTGGRASLEGNVSGAAANWFVDLAGGNLRLANGAVPAIDKAVGVADVPDDADGEPRAVGAAPDAGAYEFRDTR